MAKKRIVEVTPVADEGVLHTSDGRYYLEGNGKPNYKSRKSFYGQGITFCKKDPLGRFGPGWTSAQSAETLALFKAHGATLKRFVITADAIAPVKPQRARKARVAKAPVQADVTNPPQAQSALAVAIAALESAASALKALA
jgi:hypothetical protein